MFELIKARLGHGYQAIPDPLKAKINEAFPGLPRILSPDREIFSNAAEICPCKAIEGLSIDLGKCNFCGECQRLYPDTFRFEPDFRMASQTREGLIVRWQEDKLSSSVPVVKPDPALAKLFGRSLALRNVSAGGCNACELELGACSNVNFDMGRYGVDVVASPRHSDALIITGPITENMAIALKETWEAIPEPKLLILCGACAISGGVFAESSALDRSFLVDHPVSLYIPGCPAHPLSIIHAICSLLGRVK
jgi:Ni,Fe-hydrogenase III small subunit/ferredoxin